jgi:NTP pyrophosphatase (non-canonical NTP hydrolase)
MRSETYATRGARGVRIMWKELVRGRKNYGPFASMHEAWGVLAEEVEELTEAIRMKQGDPARAASIEREAIQVAAVALRIAIEAMACTR